jgi:Flp pilus assembly protein TadG
MTQLFDSLARMLTDRRGTSGIEFALTFPVIVLLFLGGVTLYDNLRSYYRIIEANGIVADLISRQTSIDDSFYTRLYGIFSHLQADHEARHAMRVTSVTFQGGIYKVAWTKASGTTTLLPQQVLDATTMPAIPAGDSVIYVEGVAEYRTISDILSVGTITYSDQAFSRPRFISAVAYK